ncbi:tetratricopeptide repeat protein [Desulfoferula mesophila]|uniref:Tetratricopeptide repeat protein n=1 Tax=Desulfoferula mesophila TaxID=3058419 RepID=A0AAU9EHS2_9BACT|nr:hypothetical protein FAK_36790 [Desulfoferula mesophilus]
MRYPTLTALLAAGLLAAAPAGAQWVPNQPPAAASEKAPSGQAAPAQSSPFNLPEKGRPPAAPPAPAQSQQADSPFALPGKTAGSATPTAQPPAQPPAKSDSPFALPAKPPAQAKGPSSQALVDRGVALAQEGKLDQAREAFFAAVAKDPGNAVAWNNLGLTLRRQGKLKQAAQAYEKAIKADPSYAVPYKNLGVLLEKAGERATAAKAYRRYAELAPQAPDAATVGKRAAWLESTLKK